MAKKLYYNLIFFLLTSLMKFTHALASVIALATVPTQASEFFDHNDDGLFGNFGMLKYYRPTQMPML